MGSGSFFAQPEHPRGSIGCFDDARAIIPLARGKTRGNQRKVNRGRDRKGRRTDFLTSGGVSKTLDSTHHGASAMARTTIGCRDLHASRRWSRREILSVGAGAGLGLALPDLLRARERPATGASTFGR